MQTRLTRCVISGANKRNRELFSRHPDMGCSCICSDCRNKLHGVLSFRGRQHDRLPLFPHDQKTLQTYVRSFLPNQKTLQTYVRNSGKGDLQMYDVIVVGAGPAGCTAARTLAGNGYKVLLAEKFKMPRNKSCSRFNNEIDGACQGIFRRDCACVCHVYPGRQQRHDFYK